MKIRPTCYKLLHLWKKNLRKLAKSKIDRKVRDHCYHTDKYRSAGHSICNLKFNVCNEIPVAFYNGSNNDYHFIIKELTNEFEGNLNVLWEMQKSTKLFP